MEKQKINISKLMYILSGVLAIAFILLIVLLKTVDVEMVILTGKEIGLASLNKSIFNKFGVNDFWYNLTEVFGYISLATVAYFGVLGLIQLIKRKSLKSVDKDIIIYGLFIGLIIIFYVIFEIIPINHRPILLEGSLESEASFPSSHTFLTLAIMGMSIIEIKDKIKNKYLKWCLISFCFIISLLTVIGRLLSGVHWFTDILGGVFLACSLVTLFYGLIKKLIK